MIKKWLSILATFLLYLVSLLPFWFLYLISDALFMILYYVTGYRRKVVQENLANSFPEKSILERNDIERKYYRYMADLIVETIKCVTLSEKEVALRVTPANPGTLEKYFDQGKSVIAAAGHYGNWELSCLRAGLVTHHSRFIVYKQQTNDVFTNFFNNTRSRFGATMVSMKQILRNTIAYKHEITLTVLAADQTPTLQDSRYFINFLNQPTAVFLGPEKLAQIGNAVVVFLKVERVKRGYYSYTVIPVNENPKESKPFEITIKQIRLLEEIIREKPEYWLWSHRRWKIKPENVKHANVEMID